MRKRSLLVALTFVLSGTAVRAGTLPAETCTDVIAGLQFCAFIAQIPHAGERLQLTLTTKNLGNLPISTLDLNSVPSVSQPSFVEFWSWNRPFGPEKRARLQPGYVRVLAPHEAVRATVATDYVVARGRNWLDVEIPYYFPQDTEFSAEQTRDFMSQSWRPPMVLPVIGRLVFVAD